MERTPNGNSTRIAKDATASMTVKVSVPDQTLISKQKTNLSMHPRERWVCGETRLKVLAEHAGKDLRFVVNIQTVLLQKLEPPPSAMLRSILLGNSTLDTQFILYSRRLGGSEASECRILSPRAVFASSALLISRSDYFKASK